MKYSLLICFIGFILNSCIHFERRQVSEEQVLEKSPMVDEELVAGEEPAGGGELVAGEEPVGGGELVAGEEPMGGGELVAGEESVGGGELVAGEEPVGGGELVAGEEPVGGGELVAGVESVGGGELVAGEEFVGGEEPIAVEDPTTGITWITIPSGSFMMGSDLELSEQPIHQVTVQAFEMSETEVTVAQYRRCVEAGQCSELTSCNLEGDPNWTAMPSDKENHPIICVDWGQAREFALWAGGDLPTEAQWEYAARGGESYTYAGSNNADDVAWYASNSGMDTRPVKTKIANGYGLYDISGNVYEWTLDEWHINYESAPSQAETPWGNIFPVSQIYDNAQSNRIVRGGGWYNGPLNIRVSHRNYGVLITSLSSIGFRVRRTLR